MTYWLIVPNAKNLTLALDFEVLGEVHTAQSVDEATAVVESHGEPFAVVLGVPVDDLKQRVQWAQQQFPQSRLYLAGTVSPFALGGLNVDGIIPLPLPADWIKSIKVELGTDDENTAPAKVIMPSVPVEPSAPVEPMGKDQIIAVFSGKGGDGKSTVASQLALLLAKKGISALLVDADYKGNQAEWFRGTSAPPIHSIADFRNAAPQERAVLESYLMTYKTLKILPCPQVESGHIPPDVLARAIDAYRPFYSVIVIDMHQGFSPELLKVAQYANKLIAVTVPSDRRLYPFAVTLTQLLNHGVNKKILHIVINRAHSKDAESKVRVALHDIVGDAYAGKYHVLPYAEVLDYDDDPDFYAVTDLKANDPYVSAFLKMAEAVTGLKLRSGKSAKTTNAKPGAKTGGKPTKAKSGGFLSGLFGTKTAKGGGKNAKKR